MTPANFEQSVAYLESMIPRYDKKYPFVGLERIKDLLDEMGNPQDGYAIIHVGGTAGKGSTATLAAGILQKSGYKTGLHVSPHLQDIRERSQINGRPISKQDFARIVERMKPHIKEVNSSGRHAPVTYFEALVALAFEYFKEQEVDAAVVEVGLGGRIDGTNVVKSKVSVLTNVGLDHTEILGNTIEKIASDKVCIFKKGTDVISGVTQPSVVKIVKNKARQMKCNLDLLGKEVAYDITKTGTDGSVFDFRLRDLQYKDLELSALGQHQVGNASLAVAASLRLVKSGFAIPEPAIRKALKETRIPGRFEVVAKDPLVILDGAHSPMKMMALKKALSQYYPGRKFRFVFAVKRDKDAPSMIEILSDLASKFYFTKFESTTDFGRSMSHDPDELKESSDVESEVFGTSDEAYRTARQELETNEAICITGSLYLVGEMRSRLV